jgi:hypothetical protein
MAGRAGGAAAVPAPHSAAVLSWNAPRLATRLPQSPHAAENRDAAAAEPCTGSRSMIPSRVLRRRATVLLQPRLTPLPAKRGQITAAHRSILAPQWKSHGSADRRAPCGMPQQRGPGPCGMPVRGAFVLRGGDRALLRERLARHSRTGGDPACVRVGLDVRRRAAEAGELPEWRIPPNGASASSSTVWSLMCAVPVGMRRAI